MLGVARSKQTLIPADKRLSLPHTRVSVFYIFGVFFFLVQLNVSDEDVRTFSYLIGPLICDPASAGTCLRLRRERSPVQ